MVVVIKGHHVETNFCYARKKNKDWDGLGEF